VTRIETPFLGRDEFVCLVEDSAARWLAQPVRKTAEIEILAY
jgi:hypothetical protein